DPSFPPPTESGYDSRRFPWLAVPETIEPDRGAEARAPVHTLYEARRDARAAQAWAPVHPLYEAGRYAEAADRGREVLEATPHPRVAFNVACCESLAGRTADAIEHLRLAIDMWGAA